MSVAALRGGRRAVVRVVLALTALALTLVAPVPADAQRGSTLRLRQLELTSMGHARARRGRVTRWGLAYERAGRARRRAMLEVTLIPDRGRPIQRVVELEGDRGVVPIGPARGQARVRVRALDRDGRPIALRVGRGGRMAALELRTPAARHPRRPAQIADRPRQRQPVYREPDDGRRVVPGTLEAANRACRDAFIGNDNEMRCLRLVQHEVRAPERVAACERAFSGDEMELRCLETGALPREVRACEELLTGDQAELECLVIVAESAAHPAHVDEVLRVCDERIGDDAELACVAELLGGRRAKR